MRNQSNTGVTEAVNEKTRTARSQTLSGGGVVGAVGAKELISGTLRAPGQQATFDRFEDQVQYPRDKCND